MASLESKTGAKTTLKIFLLALGYFTKVFQSASLYLTYEEIKANR